eukprot:9783396-Alexandrium_andersonii.AAC.1
MERLFTAADTLARTLAAAQELLREANGLRDHVDVGLRQAAERGETADSRALALSILLEVIKVALAVAWA